MLSKSPGNLKKFYIHVLRGNAGIPCLRPRSGPMENMLKFLTEGNCSSIGSRIFVINRSFSQPALPHPNLLSHFHLFFFLILIFSWELIWISSQGAQLLIYTCWRKGSSSVGPPLQPSAQLQEGYTQSTEEGRGHPPSQPNQHWGETVAIWPSQPWIFS